MDSAPSLNDLVSSLNVDQARIFYQVKTHLEHQVQHEVVCASVVILNHCTCS